MSSLGQLKFYLLNCWISLDFSLDIFVSLTSVLHIFTKTELPACGGISESMSFVLILMRGFHKSSEPCFNASVRTCVQYTSGTKALAHFVHKDVKVLRQNSWRSCDSYSCCRSYSYCRSFFAPQELHVCWLHACKVALSSWALHLGGRCGGWTSSFFQEEKHAST